MRNVFASYLVNKAKKNKKIFFCGSRYLALWKYGRISKNL